jgi:hypothetical protein
VPYTASVHLNNFRHIHDRSVHGLHVLPGAGRNDLRGCFVTGTGVGKTVVAAAIVARLQQLRAPVRAVTPLITGLDELPNPSWLSDHELRARSPEPSRPAQATRGINQAGATRARGASLLFANLETASAAARLGNRPILHAVASAPLSATTGTRSWRLLSAGSSSRWLRTRISDRVRHLLSSTLSAAHSNNSWGRGRAAPLTSHSCPRSTAAASPPERRQNEA